jgi:hypothetical protein
MSGTIVVSDARRFVDDFLIDFFLNSSLLKIVSVVAIAVVIVVRFSKKAIIF